MLHFSYSIYNTHLQEYLELGLIFGFEESSCCLYFVVHVRCRRKYKTSRLGFSSADEFLVALFVSGKNPMRCNCIDLLWPIVMSALSNAPMMYVTLLTSWQCIMAAFVNNNC